MKFGRPFLDHYYYMYTLNCRQEDETKNVFSLCGRAPTQNPYPVGHEVYNFGKPVLGHHYFTLSLSEPCPGVEKKI